MRGRILSCGRGQIQRSLLARSQTSSSCPCPTGQVVRSGNSSTGTRRRRVSNRSRCGCAAAQDDGGAAASGTGSNGDRIDLETFETSEVEISEEAMGGDWWKELPYVCVLLFSSDAEESTWFSVDLGDQSGSDNRIIGFESADDANLFRYIISNDNTYASLYPRVQVVSPQDLAHASQTLATRVFVLHEKQLLPSTGDSLEHICQLMQQRFYKETKLGIVYKTK